MSATAAKQWPDSQGDSDFRGSLTEFSLRCNRNQPRPALSKANSGTYPNLQPPTNSLSQLPLARVKQSRFLQQTSCFLLVYERGIGARGRKVEAWAYDCLVKSVPAFDIFFRLQKPRHYGENACHSCGWRCILTTLIAIVLCYSWLRCFGR